MKAELTSPDSKQNKNGTMRMEITMIWKKRFATGNKNLAPSQIWNLYTEYAKKLFFLCSESYEATSVATLEFLDPEQIKILVQDAAANPPSIIMQTITDLQYGG